MVSNAPRRRGFGQELIERTVPYELGAKARLVFEPGGVCATIELPLNAKTAMLAVNGKDAPNGH
jgi:two-component system CheB/CheR fusion protein